MLDWLSGFDEIDAVAVESTGAYPAALLRYLRKHGIAVVEVNQPHAHTRRRVGKSDPIDAEMAARLFQAGKAKAVPKQTDGIVESIRLLRVARHSDVKSRSAALVHVRDLIITAPQELRDQLSHPKKLRGKAAVCARFRPSGRGGPGLTAAALGFGAYASAGSDLPNGAPLVMEASVRTRQPDTPRPSPERLEHPGSAWVALRLVFGLRLTSEVAGSSAPPTRGLLQDLAVSGALP